ncbi:MAG TPA: diguanylate cyclase [Planctomycetota bacterium]|nr:diguanylate cyclase [Planctomycetota bacterium]
MSLEVTDRLDATEGFDPEGSDGRTVPVRVLVVDDEPMIRQLLTDVLGDEGYQVDTVPCGEDAVLKLRDNRFDFVITDLMMPGVSGIKVCETVKELDPETEVIVMTGYASLNTAVECMKLGAADYLNKPVNIDEIRLVLARLMEKKRLQEKAREADFYKELSRTDGLTQLYNHKFFHQLLTTEVSRAQRYGGQVSLVMLDVDHFKKYNDSNGHPMGDAALQKVAWVLSETSRDVDSVARYGGEEFAVILPETPKAGALELAERLRRRIEEAGFEKVDVMPDGKFTISLGVACFPTDASSKPELIEKADQALYLAKTSGRNRVVGWKPEDEPDTDGNSSTQNH